MRTGFWVSFPTRSSASGGRRESRPSSSANWSGWIWRQKVCRELARIVQESLVNVRKHSGAHHVLVRLAQRAGNLQLTVEDDGKGFSFSGRLSDAELETSGKGPAVIRERVRLVAGELTIESTPGHGARLEVRIPPARKADMMSSRIGQPRKQYG